MLLSQGLNHRVSPSQPRLRRKGGGASPASSSRSWLEKGQLRGLKEGDLDAASTGQRVVLHRGRSHVTPHLGFPTGLCHPFCYFVGLVPPETQQ